MTVEEFSLPDVGEGIAEGEIVSWLVEPGEAVREDQPIAEVETDKALVEVPSPYTGTVRELHVEEGAVVPVGTVIVTIEVPDEEGSVGSSPPVDDGEPPGDDGGASADGEEPPDGEAEPPTESASSSGRTFAPPSVRRLARELGVDLDGVSGSGVGGRITEPDVREHAEDDGDDSKRESPSARVEMAGDGPESGVSGARERTLAVPATRRLARELGVDLEVVPTDRTRDGEPLVTAEQVREYAAAPDAPERADASSERSEASGRSTSTSSEGRHEETTPYRGVRRATGERMQRSKFTAPHVSHHDTAEVTALVEARDRLRSRADERGIRLTYLPFVIKAVIAGLEEYPILNSELRTAGEDPSDDAGSGDAEIVTKRYYDVGIAVETDDGLLVPVVEDADELGLFELAETLSDLIERARARECSPEELRGSTFTITNFGAIGGEYATPIINPPETAILGLGAIEHRPVAEPAEELGGARAGGAASVSESGGADPANGHRVVARPTLPLSLSIDHRVIDGAVAARFMNTVRAHLEDPMLLLAE
jgi:pyruvate dehydrogenase E2 component (dihydrolipoamide acetyltransferase)